MKKIGGFITLFILIFSLVSPVLAADLFEKDLKYGMANNNDVKQLQDFLYNEGFYKGPVSGNFYSLTQLAVKKYQAANKIKPVNGILNKITRDKVNTVLLAKENAPEDVNDEITYTAEDEAMRLAWVARMTDMQNQSVSQQTLPAAQSTPQPIINNYYTSPVTYNVLPVITSSPQVVQTPQPTPNQVVTTTQTTSTPVVTTTPPVVVTNINWNIGGLSVFGGGQTIPYVKNDNGFYGPGYPYYYHYVCNVNSAFPTWSSLQDPSIGFKTNIPNETLGEGTVITWQTENLGSFWIGSSGLNQRNTGPFIKSMTIKNLGTADLSKIGLYGYFEPEISQESWSEIMSRPYSNMIGWRIDPVSFNPTFNGQEATFILPSTFKVVNSSSNVPSITTSTKSLGLEFKIDSSKMNRGETLNLQVTNVELTNPDPTKNYIYTYPTVDSSTKTLIKCDNRA